MSSYDGPISSPPNGDDAEWEYEYHETETESFYITLDLPIASNRSKKRQKRTHATSPSPIIEANPSIPPVESAQTPGETELQQDGPTAEDRPEEPRIQILNLHTRNPVISYDDQIYTCQWTTTIGTDLLLTTPEPTSTLPRLRQEKGFDLLAATRIKIVGQQAKLASRDDTSTPRKSSPGPVLNPFAQTLKPPSSATEPAEPNLDPALRAPSTNVTIQSSDAPLPTSPSTAATTPVHEVRARILRSVGPDASLPRQNQARFLERIMEKKKAKGNKDLVTVYTTKQKRKPGTGWRTQQRLAEGQGLYEMGNKGPTAVDGDQGNGNNENPDDGGIEQSEVAGWGKKATDTGEILSESRSGRNLTARGTPQRRNRPRAAKAGSGHGVAGGLGLRVREPRVSASGSTPTPRRWNELERAGARHPSTVAEPGSEARPGLSSDRAAVSISGRVRANGIRVSERGDEAPVDGADIIMEDAP